MEALARRPWHQEYKLPRLTPAAYLFYASGGDGPGVVFLRLSSEHA